MRITSSGLVLNFLRDLQQGLTRLSRLQQQLTSAKRIQKPSDDPANLPSVLAMHDALRAAEQYGRNAQDTATLLASAQQALMNATQVLQRIRDLAVQASNDTLSASDRQAIRAEVSTLLDELVSLGNAQVAGRYLFSGTLTNSPPFTRSGDVVTYGGNSGTLLREVDRGTVLSASVPGDVPFGPAFAATANLLSALDANASGAVRAALGNLDVALDALLRVQADLGARASRVELLGQRWSEFEVRLRELLSVREDADIGQVIMELQLQENVYRAALAAGARLLQPSLVDFLR